MGTIDPKIFKAYDIRGIYPQQINEDVVVSIIQASYKFLSGKINKHPITIVLGRDMRLSSPSLFDIAKRTLVSLGAHVIDIGLASTPTFYFAVYYYRYDAGIQITASHNPKEYNGIKIVLNSPTGLIKIGKSTGMDEIKQMSLADIALPVAEKGSIEEKKDVVEEEVNHALSFLKNPTLGTFTIVADPANAMGIMYLRAFFKKNPSKLVQMNFELDGSFPAHQPDPLDFNNLVDLQKRVVLEKADFGLAPDGDGDRLFFIDEKGNIIPATIITALISRELLKEHPGEKILFDIRYILTPKKIVEESGGTYEIRKVGHAFITEQLSKTGALFAGESSAHYYYHASGNAESQVITIATVLKVLTEEKKPLSQIVEELRRSNESGEINFKVTNAPEILESLKQKYSDGTLSELDGIAVSYLQWRFNVRTSNTEPLLRLNVEALDKNTMEQKRDEMV
ncbi:MAG: phosphomannomutase/phosphoglucomutase [Candidatus Levybacteria bacterium]|nr:phosphomannomutase/phosphoglucomutase [Candidatus Levybacteria bacterium]